MRLAPHPSPNPSHRAKPMLAAVLASLCVATTTPAAHAQTVAAPSCPAVVDEARFNEVKHVYSCRQCFFL